MTSTSSSIVLDKYAISFGSFGVGFILCWFSSSTFYLILGSLFLLFSFSPFIQYLGSKSFASKPFPFSSSGPVLSTTDFRPFKLIHKQAVSHNTAIYRFELPSNLSLGLPLGQHLSVKCTLQGKEYQRSYTPISVHHQLGYFDLLIKTYPQGNVSKMFSELKLGDSVYLRGPKGQFKYSPNTYSVLNMIAGGTGITPMYQLIQSILGSSSVQEKDTTKLNLIFANVTLEDILLKQELDRFAEQYPNQFKIFYVLNQPPEHWKGGTGFVSKEMMQANLDPPTSSSVKLLLCGPPPMVKSMVTLAEELGYEKAQTISKMTDQIFKF